jgi:hypothetical protein
MRAFPIVVASLLLLLSPVRTAAADDLLARAGAVNPGLHTFKATMQAHVALTSFPFLATDIVATYYHKDPDRDKLEIVSGLPGVAKEFSKLYPHIEPPLRWNETFIVTKSGDDGSKTTFKLVPRKHGNIDHIDAVIDDSAATILSMRWNYYNGGWAAMDNTYAQIGGYTVVASQTGHVEEPSYKGNITSTITGYTFNPDLPDSTFEETQ